jgi:hypothetical protein
MRAFISYQLGDTHYERAKTELLNFPETNNSACPVAGYFTVSSSPVLLSYVSDIVTETNFLPHDVAYLMFN